MKIKFRDISLSRDNKARLETINRIVEEYQRQGYKLTLRQLYYQLVSRDIIPNKVAEYAKVSNLLKEGRMAGIVDWDAIEDRLRVPYTPASFDSPEEILDAAINQYQLPRQKGQDNYMEVWVEKDALSGVLRRVTSKYHIPILVNRGYSSVSAMYDAYKRFVNALSEDAHVKILYLGDFDPSGTDMVRDIKDRILEFFEGSQKIKNIAPYVRDDAFEWASEHFEIIPIALTRDQIRQYDPPPNPAKITDPRAAKYIAEHGDSSWEVDALRPEVLNRILEDSILEHLDLDMYQEIVDREQNDKDRLHHLKDYL